MAMEDHQKSSEDIKTDFNLGPFAHEDHLSPIELANGIQDSTSLSTMGLSQGTESTVELAGLETPHNH